MKALIFMAVVELFALDTLAEEKPAQFDARSQKKPYLDWHEPEWWQREWNREELKFSLGQSDFVVTGPLFETFRLRRQPRHEPNLGEKILNLPIINLFVPQPMPRPPGGQGKYFAWGQKDLPWRDVAERGQSGPVGLISVSW